MIKYNINYSKINSSILNKKKTLIIKKGVKLPSTTIKHLLKNNLINLFLTTNTCKINFLFYKNQPKLKNIKYNKNVSKYTIK